MTIAWKILLGYGLLLILIFFHLVYSLSSLNQMDDINETIVRTHNPLIEKTNRLVENLLGQESYSRRFVILKDRRSLELLQVRLDEFDGSIREIGAIQGFASVEELSAKGSAFHARLAEAYGSLPAARALTREDRRRITADRQELITLTTRISNEVRADLQRKDELSATIRRTAIRTLLTFGMGSAAIALGVTFLFAQSIARAVGHLKLLTRQIAEGRFDEMRPLDRRDEFGEVSRTITDMAKTIERLEQLNLAASPLTHLPGGFAIDEMLRKRLEAGAATALCVIDLDNFKVVNDRYGYARGNEIIKATAAIITETVRERGTGDDFIGHIGGDDFIVLTAPERFEDICRSIIARFDREIPAFYDPEDRERRAITGTNRQGQEIVFPLMTISIAVVTDQDGAIRNPYVLSRRAADLKEHAKSHPGSIYLVDKRQYNPGKDA